jgi:hypothetical protein
MNDIEKFAEKKYPYEPYQYCSISEDKRSAFVDGYNFAKKELYSEEDMKKCFCAGFASDITSSINDAFYEWIKK